MAQKTTIQVTEDMRDLLEAKQREDESLNDVLRRELGQAVDDEVMDLTAYLDEEPTNQVQAVVDQLHEEFELDEEYYIAGEKEDAAVLEFRHPGTEMPLVRIKTLRIGYYSIHIRGPDRGFHSWRGDADSFDPDSRRDVTELNRLVYGAYQQQEHN